MIKTLTLKNFQAHKNSVLNLHPGVNVIVGETNAGKSAIIRSLYWLAFGKPPGDSIIRHNITTDCEVEVVLDNGFVIKRVRGKAANYYKIDDRFYMGFGQNVPEDVQRILNLADINFARQMDPPFLLSKSAGDVAQYLNKLVNLDVIGTSLSNISSMVRDAEKRITHHTNNIREYENKLKELDWLPDAEAKVKELEKKADKAASLKEQKVGLQSAVACYDIAMEAHNKTMNVKSIQTDIEKIEAKLTTLTKLLQKEKEIKGLVTSYTKAQEQFSQLDNFEVLENRITLVEKRIKNLQSKTEDFKVLEKEISLYFAQRKSFEEWVERELELQNYLKENMPDICPLCEQEIKEQ